MRNIRLFLLLISVEKYWSLIGSGLSHVLMGAKNHKENDDISSSTREGHPVAVIHADAAT